MPEEISRRDLLKRGAALGGAVLWTTPVVQTLGMGRAFAQTVSPPEEIGTDISYIGINVDCPGTRNDYFVKWEDGDWERKPGNAPDCAKEVAEGMDGGMLGFSVSNVTGPCADLTIPNRVTGCSVTVWVKAGPTCNTYHNVAAGTHTVCSAA